jgi:hypothetical protein
VRDVARVTGRFDRGQNRWIIQFLGIIQIVSARVTRSMKEPDLIVNRTNGADDIPLP